VFKADLGQDYLSGVEVDAGDLGQSLQREVHVLLVQWIG
jgi:hypothetical protein